MRAAFSIALLIALVACADSSRMDQTIPGAWRAENDRNVSFAAPTDALSLGMPAGITHYAPGR